MMPVGDGVSPNYWLTCILVHPELVGCTREDIRVALEVLDVESRPVWKPLHLQPLYRGATLIGGSVAERVFELGLCLPSGTALSTSEQDLVIGTVLAAVRRGT